jgi:hypothetical protein
MKKPKVLCGKPTAEDGPCWRLQDHASKCVSQRYAVPRGRPVAIVAHDGVLVASYQAFQLSSVQAYIKTSPGTHAIDVKTWQVKA